MQRPLFHTERPNKAGEKRYFQQLHGASRHIALVEEANRSPGPLLLICPDTPSALHAELELSHFAAQYALPVTHLPDWETLPYDQFSPHQDIISQRLETLSRLTQIDKGIIVLPISTLMLYVAPPTYLDHHALLLNKGDKIDIQKMRSRLENAGYTLVQQVYEHGEYAIRGSLLDLFPMGANTPVRIDIFDDEIDSLRPFDVETQRSSKEIEQFRLLPAHEFPLDKAGIETFRKNWRDNLPISNDGHSVYQQVSKGLPPAGIEYYLPLFFEQTATLFDYLPKASCIVTYGDVENAAKQFLSDVVDRYESRRYDPLRPILPPEQLFLRVDELFAQCKQYPRIELQHPTEENSQGLRFATTALPDIRLDHQKQNSVAALEAFLLEFSGKVLFSVESEGRREALFESLASLNLQLSQFEQLNQFIESENQYGVIISPAANSFVLGEQFALITETELLGRRVIRQRRKDKQRNLSDDAVIRNLAELKIGQPVVHIDHGVGRYQGLQTLDAGGMATEFLVLEYAAESKLYVPVASLHLIARYTGGDSEHAPLHKLGSDTWEKAKRKAVEKVRDVAAELLDIYAKRAAKPGYQFRLDKDAYTQFKASFPFDETDDQKKAIQEVLADMRSPNAMDRLVCGDVGFGKTEVAMRAAFAAVDDGKQVALLVPTTLLAQQHYENFRDRFANWPVRVEVLSRFNTTKQTTAILKEIEAGHVDIVVGTHKLLSQQIKFNDLGLLIVDEEHRFGVRQKEKIKQLRADVDILTLTATPIPRTLNMALSGMRDLSIIVTPPAKRLAVKTFVRQSDDLLIREAVMREVLRGGQVYFLHNDVATIEKTAAALEALVPEARIAIAHGQMRERELEQVMSDFYHQRFNLLVCTTIIETGIDVPSANTIIMNRADHLGLAQLHQLRGRVGRSHHQAYAYLLTPHPKAMTKDAQKRLDAIEQLEDLGAGFALATHDLEIRGAGELLGEDQSGQIEAIGFSLYMEMLEQAVKAMKENREPSLDNLLAEQTELELRIPSLLPEDYIFDVNMRLAMYKRIASAPDEEALRELQVELIDRFGLLPVPTKNLFTTAELKLKANHLGIRKVELGPQGGSVEFYQNTKVDPASIIRLIQTEPAYYGMDGPSRLKIRKGKQDGQDRLKLAVNLLDTLQLTA